MKKQLMFALSLLVMVLLLVGNVSPASADDFVCRGTLGKVTRDNVVVPDGASCTLNGTRVEGNVIVKTGAQLKTDGAKIDGNIQTEGHAKVVVLSTVVGGSVQIKQGRNAQVKGAQINGDLQVNLAGWRIGDRLIQSFNLLANCDIVGLKQI
ncbi:MAG: hypothetical protein HC875_24210 [Anaerolineales bacterium]|nr:hypothetical protein [Anaerolineales bacterium]